MASHFAAAVLLEREILQVECHDQAGAAIFGGASTIDGYA